MLYITHFVLNLTEVMMKWQKLLKTHLDLILLYEKKDYIENLSLLLDFMQID